MLSYVLLITKLASLIAFRSINYVVIFYLELVVKVSHVIMLYQIKATSSCCVDASFI